MKIWFSVNIAVGFLFKKQYSLKLLIDEVIYAHRAIQTSSKEYSIKIV